MNTSNTETATSSEEQSSSEEPTFLETQAQMVLAQQARAMMDLEADRCLLRRDMKARQNEQYGLGQDDLPECTEDDMGVQIGDTTNDNSKVIHNHYHNDCETPQPDPCPQPCPPVRPRLPWWLLALLVIPWIALAVLLIAWILSNWPGDGGSNPPVVWQLDIGAQDPEPIEPPTIQPVPAEPQDPVTIQPAGEP